MMVELIWAVGNRFPRPIGSYLADCNQALINYRCTPMIVDRFFRILIIGFMVNWMRIVA